VRRDGASGSSEFWRHILHIGISHPGRQLKAPVRIESEPRLQVLTRFLHANRYPPRYPTAGRTPD
jgi:hypothetical protein